MIGYYDRFKSFFPKKRKINEKEIKIKKDIEKE